METPKRLLAKPMIYSLLFSYPPLNARKLLLQFIKVIATRDMRLSDAPSPFFILNHLTLNLGICTSMMTDTQTRRPVELFNWAKPCF